MINAGICLKKQEAQFEAHLPNQAEHGWDAIWAGGTAVMPRGRLSDFLPNVLVLSLSLPLLSKPRDAVFQHSPTGLREKGLDSSHHQGMGLQGRAQGLL